MPFSITKRGEKWCLVNDETGETVACHDTEAEARQQQEALYANVPDARKSVDAASSASLLVALGGSIKALGNGTIGGLLVRFGDASQPDLSPYRDFFTKSTDFGTDEWPVKLGLYYNHGLDPELGRRRIGTGTAKMTDAGVWYEAQLRLADDYARKVYALAEAGKLGFSSGAPSHLTERASVKNDQGETVAHEVKFWSLAEASATVHPAEPGCRAFAVKSLAEWTEEQDDAPLSQAGTRSCSCGTKTALWPASSQTLREHSSAVVSANEGYAERLETRLDARVKSGRVLSAANVSELTTVRASLVAVMESLDTLLAKAQPRPEETDSEADTQGDEKPEPSGLRISTLRAETMRLASQLSQRLGATP